MVATTKAHGIRGRLRHSAGAPLRPALQRLSAVLLFLGLALFAAPASAISFVGSTSFTSKAESFDLNNPAGIAENDVMVVQFAFRGGSGVTITAPVGWTLIRRTDGSDLSQAAYYRVAGATEPAAYTWSLSSKEQAALINSAYRNVDTSAPIDADNGQAGSGVTVTAPSVTTTVDNAQLLALFSAARGSQAFTAGPAGMSTRENLASGGGPNGVRVLLADEAIVSAGATGDRQADSGDNVENIGQSIALRPAPSGAPTQVQFSVQPSETIAGQAISPAVTVRIEDGTGNVVSTSTAAVTVTIDNNPGGGTLSGTTTVNAVNGVATFSDLSIDQVADGYTLRATSPGLTDDISSAFNVVPPVQEANAFDPATPAGAITGNIRTRVAGATFSLDIVAIDNGAVDTGFKDTVVVRLLDASDNSGTLNAVNCRDSWVPIQDVATIDFDGSENGRTTLAGIQEDESWRQVRVQIERTFPPGQAGVMGCSNDAFAIRPDAFVAVQATDLDQDNPGTARVLDNTDPTAGPLHVAGRAFTLTATAVNGSGATTQNYAGSPGVEITCIASGAPCVDGLLDPGSWVASNGVIDSDTAVYDEVGAFELNLVDTDFAAVDAADSSDAERFIRSAVAVDVGRFIPADFLVTIADNGDLDAGCGAVFTYIGEPVGYATGMEPRLTITARNTNGDTTVNYRGDYARLTAAGVTVAAPTEDASQVGADAINNVTVSATITTGSRAINGDGTVTYTFDSGDDITYDKDVNARIDGFTPDIDITVTDVDDGEASAATPLPTAQPAATHEIRFGRLAVDAAGGSELAVIDQAVRAEVWDNGTWQPHADDACTSLALANEVQLDNGVTTVTGVQPIVVGGGTTELTTNTLDPVILAGGQGVLGFAAPGAGNTGFVDTTLTLTTNLPWLLGDWDDSDGLDDGPFDDEPVGRVTFGIFSGSPNWIHFRRAQ